MNSDDWMTSSFEWHSAHDDQRRAALDNSWHYIEAQIRNRIEAERCDDKIRRLERQQRDAVNIIERNKRRFVEEMSSVTITTGHSCLVESAPVIYGFSRRMTVVGGTHRWARATLGNIPTRRHITVRERSALAHEVDVMTVAMAALRRAVDRPQTGCSRASDIIGVDSSTHQQPAAVACKVDSSRRVLMPTVRGTQSARKSKSTGMTTTDDGQTASATLRRTSTSADIITTASAPSSSTAICDDSVSTGNPADEQRRGDVDKQICALGNPYQGIHGFRRSSSSKWRRELKREAPPAVNGYRSCLQFNVVLSQSERRRRLAALQSTRQSAAQAVLRTSTVLDLNFVH